MPKAAARKTAGKRTAPQPDILDRFAQAGVDRALALVLWMHRHVNPALSLTVKEADIRGFEECMSYQRITPEILIYRPEGRPAQEAEPARGSRRAIPERDAEPPRPFVIVGLVEKGTKNAIKPIENNEQDFQRGQQARDLKAWKGRAAALAQGLNNAAASGDFSTSILTDAAQALIAFANAP